MHSREKQRDTEILCGSQVSGSWPYMEFPLAFQENSWNEYFDCNTQGLDFLWVFGLIPSHTLFLLQKLSVNVLYKPGKMFIVWNSSTSSKG